MRRKKLQQDRRQKCAAVGLGLLLASALPAQSAAAQDLATLDQFADATTTKSGGIEFARKQAERGDLHEAIATLDRVLSAEPKAHEARRLQALYLCRMDDRLGGAVILADLIQKKRIRKQFDPAELEEVKAVCRIPEEARS